MIRGAEVRPLDTLRPYISKLWRPQSRDNPSASTFKNRNPRAEIAEDARMIELNGLGSDVYYRIIFLDT